MTAGGGRARGGVARGRPRDAARANEDLARAAPTLVIGVGNPDRGDDGAGRFVARRLRELAPADIVVREASGGAAEILDAWAGFARVVVVDAARSGVAPGTLLRFDASAAPLPASLARESTHGWGVAEAVELARALGRLPAELVVYALEGRRFGAGDALAPVVREAATRLALALGGTRGSPPVQRGVRKSSRRRAGAKAASASRRRRSAGARNSGGPSARTRLT